MLMNAVKFQLLILTIFLFTTNLNSQFVIKNKQVDSNMAKVDELFYSFPDSAINIATQTLKLAKSYSDKKKIAEISITLGILYVEKDSFQEAAKYYNQALEISVAESDTILMARASGNLGNLYMFIGDYATAIECFSKASEMFEALKNEPGIAISCGAIGNLYFVQEDYKKAEWYFKKALEKYEILNDTAGIATTYLDLGSICKMKQDYSNALQYFKDAEDLFIELDYPRYIGQSYANTGNVFTEKGEFKNAYEYLNVAMSFFVEAKNEEDIARCNLDLAEVYLKQKRNSEAGNCINQAEEIALENNFIWTLLKVYEKKYKYLKASGNISDALEYHEKLYELSDSLVKAEKETRVAELSARYDLNRKENDILALNQSNRIKQLSLEKKNNLIILLSGVYFLSSLFLVLLILFLRQRTKTKQKIIKQEMQANALKAIIEAEDKERARFASDLHDGLGPLLSTAKLFAEQITRNSGIDGDTKELASSVVSIINESIDSARQISHNMSPDVLKQQGLKAGVNKLLEIVKNAGKINVVSDIRDVETDEITARYIYRIIQELLNNTVKYAMASEIQLNIGKNNDGIKIHYSDNGKGFDMNKSAENIKPSSGMENIKNRVKESGGEVTIISSPGNGFVADILFKK